MSGEHVVDAILTNHLWTLLKALVEPRYSRDLTSTLVQLSQSSDPVRKIYLVIFDRSARLRAYHSLAATKSSC